MEIPCFHSSRALRHTIIRFLFITAVASTSYSCDNNSCESDNTGSIIVENTSASATLHVFINPGNLAVNALGDLVVEPGEKQSTGLPAGDHILKAILRVTNCSGSRCSVSNTGQPDRTITLLACEDKNLVY